MSGGIRFLTNLLSRLGISAQSNVKPLPPTASCTSAVFVARGLSKTYRMGDVEVTALRSIDLDIQEGEFVVLLATAGVGEPSFAPLP
jgi:putative ABC transport system ATP-binding protein